MAPTKGAVTAVAPPGATLTEVPGARTEVAPLRLLVLTAVPGAETAVPWLLATAVVPGAVTAAPPGVAFTLVPGAVTCVRPGVWLTLVPAGAATCVVCRLDIVQVCRNSSQ